MSALSPPQEEVVVATAPKRKRRRSVLGRPPQTLGELLAFRIEQVERQMAENRLEVREQFKLAEKRTDDLRQEMNQQFARLDAKIDRTRGDMTSMLSWQTGLIGVMLAILGLVVIWVRH